MELEGTLVIPRGWFGAKKYLCRPDIVVDTYEGEKLDRSVIYKLSLINRKDKSANLFKHLAIKNLDGKKVRLRGVVIKGMLIGETVEAYNVDVLS